jgi:DNA-binding response OmpR family regulator
MQANPQATLQAAAQAAPPAWIGLVGPRLKLDPALLARLHDAGLHTSWLAGPEAALAAARQAAFDALLLDAELATPTVLLQLRAVLDCGVLVVGAHDEEVEELLALECGADGYLPPPLSARRLLVHLQAHLRLRRRLGTAARRPARFAGWRLCRDTGRLSGHGLSVELSMAQARLMAVLMEADGQPVARRALREALPRGAALDERSVDVYLSRLRHRLAEERVTALELRPVRGCGYVLALRADAADAADPPDTTMPGDLDSLGVPAPVARAAASPAAQSAH